MDTKDGSTTCRTRKELPTVILKLFESSEVKLTILKHQNTKHKLNTMPSSVQAKGKGLLNRLRGGKKESVCDKDHDGVIDESFQTSGDSPNNSERSTLGDAVKKSSDLPYFFYEEEAHDPSPYVSMFSDHWAGDHEGADTERWFSSIFHNHNYTMIQQEDTYIIAQSGPYKIEYDF